MLCIKNATLYDGIGPRKDKVDILIDNGKIYKIDKNISCDNRRVIDASGKIVIPGLIDAHCHLREPGYEYKEDISSGTKSAAAGGFTSIACMPNTLPVIDNAAVVEYIRTKARDNGSVKVYPIGAITKGQKGKELTEMGELKEAGVVALSDDGQPVENSNLMRLAMEYGKSFKMLLISHCEESSLVDGGVMNEGYMSTVLGLKGISRAAEEVMVARDIILAETTRAPIHIAHVSTRGSIEIIRQAKIRGVNVTCETAPHYYSASDEWVKGYDTNTKVNPPLRTNDDVNAVKDGLKDGTIDIIATDHAPHHRDEKNVEYDLAANGISGFETAFALSYTNLVEAGILTIEGLIKKMSTKPAEILGIEGGILSEGKPADLAIIDIDQPYKIDVNTFLSKGKNSPFHNQSVKGKIIYTMVDGEIVIDKSK